jgi:hypothetical protein
MLARDLVKVDAGVWWTNDVANRENAPEIE